MAEKLSPFDEYWSPKIVALVNDYDVQVVKPRPFPTLACSRISSVFCVAVVDNFRAPKNAEYEAMRKPL